MKVWVAAYDHKHGTDIGVYESEEAAYANIAKMIRDYGYWDEAFEQIDGDTEIMTPKPPADDHECVWEYFKVMGDQLESEWIDIDLREVQTLESVRAKP
jgi:hypothetical protein